MAFSNDLILTINTYKNQPKSMMDAAKLRIQRVRGILSNSRATTTPQRRNRKVMPLEEPKPTHTTKDIVVADFQVYNTYHESFNTYMKTESAVMSYKLRPIIALLSSSDVDQNRVGFQKLLVLTKSRLNTSASQRDYVSRAIVNGHGKQGKRLQDLVLSFISDKEEDVVDDVDKESASSRDDVDSSSFREVELRDSLMADSDSVSLFSTASREGPQGRAGGCLQSQALRVVTNALSGVYHTQQQQQQQQQQVGNCEGSTFDFKDTFWRRMVDSLLHNIEENYSTDATGYSLRVLRLLYALEPTHVGSLLRYILLPHLVHLYDTSELHGSPLVTSEASQLLVLVNAFPSKRIEI